MASSVVPSRLPAAVIAGLLAAMIAHEAGVPWWRDWQIGDASDIGLTTGWLVFTLLRFMRPSPPGS